MKDSLDYSSLQSELIAILRIIQYLTEERVRIETELSKLGEKITK